MTRKVCDLTCAECGKKFPRRGATGPIPKTCSRICYQRNYRPHNLEKIRAYGLKWYYKNFEKTKEYRREYGKANRVKRNEDGRRRRRKASAILASFKREDLLPPKEKVIRISRALDIKRAIKRKKYRQQETEYANRRRSTNWEKVIDQERRYRAANRELYREADRKVKLRRRNLLAALKRLGYIPTGDIK